MMRLEDWNMEDALKVRYLEGFEQGYRKGVAKDIIRRMYSFGLPSEEIALLTNTPIEIVKSFEEEGSHP